MDFAENARLEGDEGEEVKRLKVRLFQLEEKCLSSENEREEVSRACLNERNEIQNYLKRQCDEFAFYYRLERNKSQQLENQLKLRLACNRGLMNVLAAKERSQIAMNKEYNEEKRATESYKGEISRLQKSIRELEVNKKKCSNEMEVKRSSKKNRALNDIEGKGRFSNTQPVLPPIKSKQRSLSFFIPNSPPPSKDVASFLPTPPSLSKPEVRYLRKTSIPSAKKRDLTPLPPIGREREVLLPLRKRLQ